MNGQILMNIGTWLLAIAAIPQLIEIWKNKHDLRGYSFYGSLILFVGLSLIALSFWVMEMWISVAAQIVPLIMWAMATWYSRGK